jgi:tetratricopeptide (TPR) repeat protein
MKLRNIVFGAAVTLTAILAAPECAAAGEFICDKIIHGRADEALKHYQKAEQTPQNLYCLANLYRLEKKQDEALEVLGKIEINKLEKDMQEQVLASFASVYFDKGDYQNMKKNYEALLQLNPKSHFKDIAMERIKQTS